MKKVIVVGSGGHAKVVIDILHEMNELEIIGITSHSIAANEIFCGHQVLGNDDVINNYMSSESGYLAMGIGGFRDNHLRESVFSRLKSMGFKFINVIHPSAAISRTASLGEGIVIFPGVIINAEVHIGDDTIIATGSTIDHETVIGNHVLVSAGVTVGAYSYIMSGALLALGSKVVSGIKIGADSLVAAGAVVVKDVEDNKIVYGIPAKQK